MVGLVKAWKLASKSSFFLGVAGSVILACGAQKANLGGGSPDGGSSSGSLVGMSGTTGGPSSGAGGSGAASSGNGGTTGASSSGAGGGPTSGAGAGGPGPLAGTGGCPIYNAPCNGVCTVIAGDPKNCGACGVVCPAGQICAGGVCGGTCPPGGGETACNGSCVDLQTSNTNCGTCGNACGANQGCAGGACGAAKTFPTPAACAGGGPQIVINPMGSAPLCLGNVAQTTFTFGVCSCTNVDFEDNALVDGWNSTYGPYKPGQLGGGVGADGEIIGMSTTTIWGDAWAASPTASFGVSTLNVHYDLESGGNIVGDSISVTHDATVAGNITGPFTVGGTLYQTPGKAHPAGAKLVMQNVMVPPPCDCSMPIPVAAAVAAAKTNNMDAAIGLDPNIMNTAHPTRIDLPCGVYYMLGFSSGGTIVAHGHVALFIDGNASSSGGTLTMTVADAQSTFDIWISGTITTASSFFLGNTSYPALTRVYVGGTQTLDIQAELTIGAELWAGNATVLWESTSDMYGALFAHNFQVLSAFNLHSDNGVLYAGAGCPSPGTSGSPPGSGMSTSGVSSGTPTSGTSSGTTVPMSDAGGPTPMCGTCKDCGNQACISGTCGSCTTNAQCCPPLVCTAGTCSPPIIR